jgi:phage-related protein
MRARILRQRTWTICALEDGSSCPAEEYISNLLEADKKKVFALLERTAAHGPPHNEQKFRKVEGDLFEFKSFQDRLLCFFQPNSVIILTHGFRKKRERIPRGEIQRAERLRRQYLEG